MIITTDYGTGDPLVRFKQSEIVAIRSRSVAAEVSFHAIERSGHGNGAELDSPELVDLVAPHGSALKQYDQAGGDEYTSCGQRYGTRVRNQFLEQHENCDRSDPYQVHHARDKQQRHQHPAAPHA